MAGVLRRLVSGSVAAASALLLTAAAPALAGPTAPLAHQGRWITDTHGRVVILHGLNMVYKVAPYYPSAIGFGSNDARFLHRNGFNTVRLGFIYKGAEPSPGSFDDGYIDHIRSSERILARHDVFTLLDSHQDLYNERFQGEGWPDWAVQDDGLPAQPQEGFPGNYLVMPALNRAFDHFWNNDPGPGGVGLQDRFAAAWRHIARRFRGDPGVLGYDLLNEPWPGSAYASCASNVGCPVFDSTTLTDFVKRTIAGVRKADSRTLVFYEPLLTFDFGANTSLGDTGDPRAGMSFHVYCLPGAFGGPTGAACQTAEDLPFQNADAHSQSTDDALLQTEFGATNDVATLSRIVTLADQHMVGWQEWQYTGYGDITTQAATSVEALVKNPAKSPSGTNVKRNKLRALNRPYPQVINGRPTSYSYDPGTNVFRLTYRRIGVGGHLIPRHLPTEVFVPRLHYRHGYVVTVKGATVTSDPGSQFLKLIRKRDVRKVTVKVTPAS